jgi:HAD superfamily hydrolase (TIGR01549 family)
MTSETQAVIFDMDGVIVDSEPRHERAFLEVVRELGYAGRLQMRFSDFIGRSDHELWVEFIEKHQPPHSLEELLTRKRKRTIEILRREQPLFQGLPELIESLAPHYELGLASGSERLVVQEVLLFRGIGRYFKAIVTAADVARGKPDPAIFLRAAQLLAVRPENCWVIEDSKPGVASGLAAGMRVIAISNTHRKEELSHATHVVSTYEEIGRLLVRTR